MMKRNGLLMTVLMAGLVPGAARAQDIDLFAPGGETALGGFNLNKELKDALAPPDDRELLRHCHYSEVYRWTGVAPARPAADQDVSGCAWKAEAPQEMPPRVLAAPRSPGEAWTMINIPETRAYRVWLGYQADPGQPMPVTLTLSGSNRTVHVFGRVLLSHELAGEEIERTQPIRFEDELARMKRHSLPVMVWEYVDLDLTAGATRFALSSEETRARVDGIVVSGSRTGFSPAKSAIENAGNLYRAWCRVRVKTAAPGVASYTVPSVSLGYHWRRIPRGQSEPTWYSSLGTADKQKFVGEDGKPAIAVGAWTRWVEVTEDVMDGRWARGGGPWATVSVPFAGVEQGTGEAQFAWYPHEGGVLKTITPGISEGRAVFMMPLERLGEPPVTNGAAGAWGMRKPEVLARFESAEDVHARHFAWGREAVAGLGGATNNPRPRLIRITTSFSPAPAARGIAARMLESLGINDVAGFPADVRAERGLPDPVVFSGAADSEYLFDTHEPLDPVAEQNVEATLRKRAQTILKGRESDPPLVRIVMGDEIGSEGGGATINGFASSRRAFHDYLRACVAQLGTNAAYFGVADVEELPFLDEPGDRPGVHAGRLYYASERFKFIHTALYYAQITRAAERIFPRVQTYCNFSPHPPMFGQHMNGSDWFALTRHGGANMAWGECWASGGDGKGSWGFNGFEVVGYYAAWVECAARVRGGLPAGFYVVGTTGGSDRKIFSLLGRGIHWITAYSWGPMYSGAEGSNFWSENPKVYGQIARATHAIGPADAIIARGRREPRRAGVLYNRAHEIWNGAEGGFQTDRLLQFTALSHAHVPAEILLEEDCTDKGLAGYLVLYIQGYNFEGRTLDALRRWVEAGGVLVAAAGTALRDESNTATGADEALFGARQRPAGMSRGGWHPQVLPDHEPIDKLTLQATDLTPALTADVIGVKVVLEPTTGTPVGTFADGRCAAVMRTLGKGRTLLFGFQPGMLYKGSAPGGSRYMLERLPLLAQPAQLALGRMRVEYSEPQTEVWLFEHEGEAAVTLNNFAHFLEPAERAAVLTVQTDLPVKEVFSTLKGPLRWTREGDRIRVDLTTPETVDVVVMR